MPEITSSKAGSRRCEQRSKIGSARPCPRKSPATKQRTTKATDEQRTADDGQPFFIIPTMPDLSPERAQQFARMRETTREIFAAALSNASIENACARTVHCERRVLRIGDDLYDLDTYNRVFVVSIGKAGHTMAAALETQLGSSLEGIVASSVEPASQVRGFRYFRGGHPAP